MMGYAGQQQRFAVELVGLGQGGGGGGGGGDGERLPTASTCFNTLKLCAYASREVLEGKLRLALALAEGFDEAAVAVG